MSSKVILNKKGDETLINLYIGSKCNLKCKYCFEKNNIIEDLSEENINDIIYKINKVIDNSKNSVNIELAGREVTLYVKEYSKILSSINNIDKVKYISTVTNGYMINDEFIEFINTYKINSVAVSIDLGERVHNINRVSLDNKHTFRKILDNIILIKNKTNTNITVSSVYDPEVKPTYQEFIQLVDFIIDNDVTHSYKIAFKNDLEINDKEDVEFIFDLVYKTYQHIIHKNKLLIIRLGSGFDISRLDEYMNEDNFKIDCNARRSITISPNKKSYSCMMAFSDKDTFINKSLFEVHNVDDPGNKLIEAMSKNFECNKCKVKGFCRGACPILYINNGINVCIEKRKMHAIFSIKYFDKLLNNEKFIKYYRDICKYLNKEDKIYNNIEYYKKRIKTIYTTL